MVDRRSSTWKKEQYPLGVLLLPASDLGLPSNVQGELIYPDDVPITLSANIVQTPSGPRLLQTTNTGAMQTSLFTPLVQVRNTTEAAGTYGNIDLSAKGYRSWNLLIWLQAFTGAPTNIIYTPQASLDGGTTWLNMGTLTMATVAKVGGIFAGSGSAALAASGDFVGNAGLNHPLTGALLRLTWAFTGGAAPTATHRFFECYS